ncbi:MAG: cupin domain-containing protein [Verrucomicrobiales bacterium]|nr:cupin domain-containing protein [Verrucomicrobiales bacterium]
MSTPKDPLTSRRFVTAAEKVDYLSPWTLEEWLCRGDVVPNEELLMVRANMEAGRCHPFHTHPTREEIIYILSGRAEQWINGECRILGPGEMVLVRKGEVHGTYNPYRERLVFLAILSPAQAAEPGIVDVSGEEPWATLRERRGLPACT